jgi:hypothetical protein
MDVTELHSIEWILQNCAALNGYYRIAQHCTDTTVFINLNVNVIYVSNKYNRKNPNKPNKPVITVINVITLMTLITIFTLKIIIIIITLIILITWANNPKVERLCLQSEELGESELVSFFTWFKVCLPFASHPIHRKC